MEYNSFHQNTLIEDYVNAQNVVLTTRIYTDYCMGNCQTERKRRV